MGRFISLRALSTAVVIAAIAPGSAFGTQPAHVQDRIMDSFAADVCGISVEVDINARVNVLVYADGAIKDLTTIHITYINPANSQSIIYSAFGPVDAPAPIIDEQARTLTIMPLYRGLSQQIREAHGPLLLRDAGILQQTTVLDLDTFQAISSEISILRGPHPDVESGFTLFCDVLSAALL